MAKNLQIALFGGAFDPPHNGHLEALQRILASGRFDAIWVSPTSVRADKLSCASDKHRIAMARLLLDYEVLGDNVSLVTHLSEHSGLMTSTYAEICYLMNKNPDVTFSVVIGQDQADALSEWSNIDLLQRLVQFFVIPRYKAISSTQIRKSFGRNKPIASSMPQAIEEYIISNKLYLKENSDEKGTNR